MSYQIITGTERSIEDKLNGTVLSGVIASTGAAVGGRTLIFSSPAVTVTFGGTVGSNRTVAQIVAEIEAAVSGMDVQVREQGSTQSQNPTVAKKVVLSLARSGGFTLEETGTANAALGFSTTQDTVSTGAVDATRIKGFTPSASPGTYALILSDS